MPWELCPKVYWSDSKAHKFDFRGLKGQLDVKKVNLRGIIVKIGHRLVVDANIGL